MARSASSLRPRSEVSGLVEVPFRAPRLVKHVDATVQVSRTRVRLPPCPPFSAPPEKGMRAIVGETPTGATNFPTAPSK